jgi:type IV pilus assembly protein PilB
VERDRNRKRRGLFGGRNDNEGDGAVAQAVGAPEAADPPAETDDLLEQLAADNGLVVEDAGDSQSSSISELVADLIAATGLLPPDRIAALRLRAGGESFAEAIVEAGDVPELVAERYGMPYVDLQRVPIDTAAATLVPRHILERASALPYAVENGKLKVAVADPTDLQTIDELRLATRYPLELAIASPEDIELELKRIVRAGEMWERAALVQDESSDEPSPEDLEADDGISDAPLVRLVNSIILQAAEDGASDLHFDPIGDALVVRMRIDGILHEVQRLPKRLASAVTTRLKVLSKLDIAERRKPQDGRISLSGAAGRALDIRVAVLPSVEGEMVVMRLLDKSKRPPTLTELGLSEEMRAEIEALIRKPTGALLVTGPTGSGKSTTLYGILSEINRPEINVITVEDPVEYRLTGVNQVQINPKAGLTFASALRTILRSDPDVIMVGEIRDVETAKISIESALTGHFVLSTLHTNDAPGALTRLNEMGVEPFLTGSAVTAVLAQRLARRLCSHCCEVYNPTPEELAAARFTPEMVEAAEGAPLFQKRGCPRCSHTGYRGRVGIFQLMVMTDDLERLAAQHANRDEIELAALEAGMRALWDDGTEKVLAGVTSLEELGRVLV